LVANLIGFAYTYPIKFAIIFGVLNVEDDEGSGGDSGFW